MIISNNTIKKQNRFFFRSGKREHHKVGIEPAICICVTNAGTIKNLDAYLDYSYVEAKEKFAEYIAIHGIKRNDVDCYLRKYPMATFKYYYELELDHVLA